MNKELKTNIKGLSVICSDDGVWLSVVVDSKSEMLNLSNLASFQFLLAVGQSSSVGPKQGGIRGSALLEWCKQTAKESVRKVKKVKKVKKWNYNFCAGCAEAHVDDGRILPKSEVSCECSCHE